jgi:aryl-alcohol dehydrogenase-like predicted oxidoreductase
MAKATIDAAASGQFLIGGDFPVNRLGFGAMRITGEGIWGDPEDPVEARRTVRALAGLHINFIDTADSYGPFVSEDLLAEVLAPFPSDLLVATKGGLVRPGRDEWVPLGRPEYLKQCVLMSLRRLKRERLDLWQLHRIDPKVPRDEQFGVMAELRKNGLIRHLGLSEVTVEEIRAAERFFPVATVQNLYNLVDRKSEEVLAYCEKRGIGFIPWFPLASGKLAEPGGVVDAVARKLRATPAQVALAWVLQRSPAILPIPGTDKVSHLEQNTAAASLRLPSEDFAALDRAGHQAWDATVAQGTAEPR